MTNGRWWLAGLVGLGAVGSLALAARHSADIAAQIGALAALGPAGAVAFAVVYVVGTVLMVPASVLEAGAGFLFGPLWGVPFASACSTLGATISFLLGRTVLRGVVERQIATDARWAAIDGAVANGGLRLVLLLRLSPLVPFNAASAVLGGTRVSLRDYVVGTAVGHVLPIAMFAYAGSTVGSALELVDRPALPTWVSALVVVATGAATLGATRIIGRGLAPPA